MLRYQQTYTYKGNKKIFQQIGKNGFPRISTAFSPIFSTLKSLFSLNRKFVCLENMKPRVKPLEKSFLDKFSWGEIKRAFDGALSFEFPSFSSIQVFFSSKIALSMNFKTWKNTTWVGKRFNDVICEQSRKGKTFQEFLFEAFIDTTLSQEISSKG